MKKRYTYIIALMGFVQCVFSQKTKEDLINIQRLRFASMVQSDVKTLETLLANELTYAHTTGWIENKKSFLHTVASKKVDYLSIETSNIKVRFYGETAVITGAALVKLNVDEKYLELSIGFLEIQHFITNSWQLVAWQAVKNSK